MISTNLLRSLVLGLPAILVANVLAALGYAISHSVGDGSGATGFWYLGLLCMLLLAGNVLLLVFALGVLQLQQSEQREVQSHERTVRDSEPT